MLFLRWWSLKLLSLLLLKFLLVSGQRVVVTLVIQALFLSLAPSLIEGCHIKSAFLHLFELDVLKIQRIGGLHGVEDGACRADRAQCFVVDLLHAVRGSVDGLPFGNHAGMVMTRGVTLLLDEPVVVVDVSVVLDHFHNVGEGVSLLQRHRMCVVLVLLVPNRLTVETLAYGPCTA